MEWLTMERWSPYAAGVGIGIVSWLAFLFSDKPIGCSTAFARTSGMIEKLFRGKKVHEKPYYQQFAPKIDWEWMVVTGIVGGAFLSSILSGQFSFSWIPAMWRAEAGGHIPTRLTVSLFGGIVMGFGARWAGGCTSGHGISGTLQLAISSWLATICFFISGIVTALFLYHVLL